MAHRSSVWLKTDDGQVPMQVERDIIDVCPYVRRIRSPNFGVSVNSAIVLPKEVNTTTLELILQYCRVHQDRRELEIEELMLSDDELIRLNGRNLDKVALAANSLGLKHLAELAAMAIERTIKVLTPRETKDSLQEELERINVTACNLRIRMLNELLQRTKAKQKEKMRREEGGESVCQGSSVEVWDDSYVSKILSTILGKFPEEKRTGRTYYEGKERAQDSSTAEGSKNRNQSAPSTAEEIMGRFPKEKGTCRTESKGKQRAQDSSTAEGSENRNQSTPSTEEEIKGRFPEEKGTERTESKGKERVQDSRTAEGSENRNESMPSTEEEITRRNPKEMDTGRTESRGKEKAQDSSQTEGSENKNQNTHSTVEAPRSTDDLRDRREAQVIGETKSRQSMTKKARDQIH